MTFTSVSFLITPIFSLRPSSLPPSSSSDDYTREALGGGGGSHDEEDKQRRWRQRQRERRRRPQCAKCMLIHEKHANVLQYKESKSVSQ